MNLQIKALNNDVVIIDKQLKADFKTVKKKGKLYHLLPMELQTLAMLELPLKLRTAVQVKQQDEKRETKLCEIINMMASPSEFLDGS